jgi:hypothetical protein
LSACRATAGGRRHLFHGEVEGLAGGGEAEGRQQHDRAAVDRAPDRHAVDLAHEAAVHEVDAVDDAHGRAVQEVAGDDPHRRVGHRGVGQALRERASISKRSWPAASCAQSSATSSVMRLPWL